jgi:beta-lactamase class A
MKLLLLALLTFTSASFASIQQEIQAIEQQSSGRLGVSAIDNETGQLIEYRSQERFPFCSTFKVMGVAAILKASMKDSSFLNRKIHYLKKDLVEYSPITKKHIGDGMTITELCHATITTSDNTAMNLLMRILGGPETISHFARTIDDYQFNLTRWEPDLNSAIPSDKRDTTTPKAMRISLKKLLLGNILDTKQKSLLHNWLILNTTGNNRIRAGVPNGWHVADKTGTGDYGTTNDIGIVYPPHCKPIFLIVYFTQKEKQAAANESVIACVTKKLITEFGKTNKCVQK